MLDSNDVKIKQYTIASELLEKGYPLGGGPCTCSSVCCSHGVFADVKERDLILAHKDMIKKYMDETQPLDESMWFEDHEEDDTDFASGRCVGTQVVNDKCALLDKTGRCSAQVAAASEGMHKWALKPLYCILFPIDIANNKVQFDDMLDDEEKCCSIGPVFETPMFEGCKEELVHLLGSDGYEELDAQYRLRKSASMTEGKVA